MRLIKGIIALAAVMLCACACFLTLVALPRAWPKTYDVLYRVEATQGTQLRYDTQNGHIEFTEMMEDHWRVKFKARSGDILYLSAQTHSNESYADCYIIVNGKLFKVDYADNDNFTAECGGRLP